MSMPSACWVEIRTVSTRTGLCPSYSIVTWVFPSGRRYGRTPRLADLRQALREPMREPDRRRHQLGLHPFVACEAEHHALVARAEEVELVLLLRTPNLEGFVDALRDVRRLLLDRDAHATGVAVEAVLRTVVADVHDRLPDDLRDIDVRRRGDLARDHREPGRDEGLARNATVRVVAEDLVEDRVGDLVGQLVRVPLGHRFGRERRNDAPLTFPFCRCPARRLQESNGDRSPAIRSQILAASSSLLIRISSSTPVRGNDRRLIRLGLEARPRLTHDVADDHVGVLAGELLLGVLDHLLRLRGE